MSSPVVCFAVALLLGLTQAPPPQAPPDKAPAKQEKAPAKTESKATAKKPKRVFTNDDVAPGQRAPEQEEPAEEGASKPAKTKSKADGAAARPEETREYYSERMSPLRIELNQVESELSSARYKPEYDPQTGRPIISHSKQNEIERLERKRADLQKKISAVCEEAVRNNVYVSGC